MTRPDDTGLSPSEVMARDGSIELERPGGEAKLVRGGFRTLYQIIEVRSGEIVGMHEDGGVAELEQERLNAEAREEGIAHLGEDVVYAVLEEEILCSDDPDDALGPLHGPIVSDGEITKRNLKRG